MDDYDKAYFWGWTLVEPEHMWDKRKKSFSLLWKKGRGGII
jgi:hypothetical protein